MLSNDVTFSCRKDSRSYWTRDKLRTPMGWFRAHQFLSCFQNHVMDVVGNSAIVLQSIAIFAVCIPIYLAIKMDETQGDVHLRVFMTFLFLGNLNILMVGSHKAGNIYEKSHTIYLYWKTTNDPQWNLRNDKLFKRCLKSFSPLKIRLNSFCFYDRSLVVSTLQRTFDNTINLLITNPLNLL